MLTYKQAGVDIDAGDELVKRIQKFCPNIGGFGGLYPHGDGFLVAGTDGVGTKLKIAFAMDKHDTIGIDLVAMNVNDVLTVGAKPLFFLDYFATSTLDVDTAEQVIKGIIAGCEEAGCPLLGGETAELPGLYHEGEYDLAGFCVGSVSKEDKIDGEKIVAGDLIVGIPSSGIHSNGYSLVRAVIDKCGASLHAPFEECGKTLGELLLTPTRIYVKMIHSLLEEYAIKGMAHITGGGMPGNIPRIFPKGIGATLTKGSWTIPRIFSWLQEKGDVPEDEMYLTFNMGIGMVLVMGREEALRLCSTHKELSIIGETLSGEGIRWKQQ